MGMFITVNGTKQKINSKGETYGWASTVYSTVESWAGDKLIEESNDIKPQDAIDEIIMNIRLISPNIEDRKIKRFIGF